MNFYLWRNIRYSSAGFEKCQLGNTGVRQPSLHSWFICKITLKIEKKTFEWFRRWPECSTVLLISSTVGFSDYMWGSFEVNVIVTIQLMDGDLNSNNDPYIVPMFYSLNIEWIQLSFLSISRFFDFQFCRWHVWGERVFRGAVYLLYRASLFRLIKAKAGIALKSACKRCFIQTILRPVSYCNIRSRHGPNHYYHRYKLSQYSSFIIEWKDKNFFISDLIL